MPDRSAERVIDVNRLRRSCADCSLRLLCPPAGVLHEEVVTVDWRRLCIRERAVPSAARPAREHRSGA